MLDRSSRDLPYEPRSDLFEEVRKHEVRRAHGAFASGLNGRPARLVDHHLTRFDSRTTDAQHRTLTRLHSPPGSSTIRRAGEQSASREPQDIPPTHAHGSASAGCSRVRASPSPATSYSRAPMHIGALIFPTDLSIRPDRLAAELEAAGFESLWVTEHTHIPTSRRTPWPGGPSCPRSTAARSTRTSRSTAAATRDRAAAPRHRHHARRPARPDRAGQDGRLARPPVAAAACCSASASAGTRTRWSTTASTRSGGAPWPARTCSRCASCGRRRRRRSTASSCSFSPSWSWPKPVSDPHPPILMGGAGGPVTFRHVVEYCDGWMPIHGRRNIADKLDDAAPGRRRGRAGHGDDRARRVRLPGRPRRHRQLRRAGLHPLRARRAADRRGRRAADASTALRRRRRPLRPRLTARGPRRRPGLGRRGGPASTAQRDRGSSPSTPTARSSTPGGRVASTRRRRGWRTWATHDADRDGRRPARRAQRHRDARRASRRSAAATAAGRCRPTRPTWPCPALAGVVAGGAARRRDGWRCADGRDGPPAARPWLYESFPYTTLVGAAGARLRPSSGRSTSASRATSPPAEFRALRAANCDELDPADRRLRDADPPIDLRSHPVTATLLDEPTPLVDRAGQAPRGPARRRAVRVDRAAVAAPRARPLPGARTRRRRRPAGDDPRRRPPRAAPLTPSDAPVAPSRPRPPGTDPRSGPP